MNIYEYSVAFLSLLVYLINIQRLKKKRPFAVCALCSKKKMNTLLWTIFPLLLTILGSSEASCLTSSTVYENEHEMADLANFKVAWTVSADMSTIEMKVEAPTTGWVGFGLSDGGMKGADIIMVTVDDQGTVSYDDYHSVAEEAPTADDSNDWTLIEACQSGGYTYFVAERAVVATDTQDWSFVVDDQVNQMVVAAYGSSDDVTSYHGGSARATGFINWKNNTESSSEKIQSLIADENITSYTFTAMNYTVSYQSTQFPGLPSTTYYEVCHNLTAVLGEEEVHAIALDMALDDVGRDYNVHHITVYGYNTGDDGGCSANKEMMYTWAPGVEPFISEYDAGFRLGGSKGYRSLKIQFHYENPTGTTGTPADFVDDSGISMYWTSTLKNNDLKCLVVGDPQVALFNTANSAIVAGTNQFTFACPNSDCFTGLGISNNITIINMFHHMHGTGAAMRTRFYDATTDEVIKTVETQYYNFDYQGSVAVAPFQIPETAYADVTCVFESRGQEWGYGTDNEMCMTFLTILYPTDANYTSGGSDHGLECGYHSTSNEYGASCTSFTYEETTYGSGHSNTVDDSNVISFRTFLKSSSSGSSSSDDSSSSSSSTIIIGATAGSAFVVVVVAAGAYFVLRARRRVSTRKFTARVTVQPGGPQVAGDVHSNL